MQIVLHTYVDEGDLGAALRYDHCRIVNHAALASVTPGGAPPAAGVSDGDAQLALWMTASVSGDTRAFEQLYRTMAPRVRAFLRSLSGDELAAEDLTQTTFLKVYRARGSYLTGAPVIPWIFAIARRSWLDARRTRRRRPEHLSDDGSVPEPPMHDEAPDGFDRLDAAVLDSLLARFDALPDAQREAIVLLKLKGLSVADAAQIAGVTPGALKVRAHRGYESLRRAVGVRRPP
jgi:RNA polymerase sigma-70 factor (ECF subfamily)